MQSATEMEAQLASYRNDPAYTLLSRCSWFGDRCRDAVLVTFAGSDRICKEFPLDCYTFTDNEQVVDNLSVQVSQLAHQLIRTGEDRHEREFSALKKNSILTNIFASILGKYKAPLYSTLRRTAYKWFQKTAPEDFSQYERITSIPKAVRSLYFTLLNRSVDLRGSIILAKQKGHERKLGDDERREISDLFVHTYTFIENGANNWGQHSQHSAE